MRKKEGNPNDQRPARFPYSVVCGACGFSTEVGARTGSSSGPAPELIYLRELAP